jgi:dynactin 1
MRGRAASFSTLCKRFASILRRCDPTSFLNIGRIYPEIAPMEKRIDLHIDLLRRDEFREMEFVSDVLKCVSLHFDTLISFHTD